MNVRECLRLVCVRVWRAFVRWTALVAAILAASGASAAPNILVFIADDMTYSDAGALGNPIVHTPNLDLLAARGTTFTHLFTATAMCSPTRHMLYSGQYPVRSGTYPNHAVATSGTTSVVDYLSDLGYRVGISGKTHIWPRTIYRFEMIGNVDDDEAIGWFMRRGTEQAFALFVGLTEPHLPWDEGDSSRYDEAALTLPPYFVDTPETREALTRYYAEITHMDGRIGEILALLERHGEPDNTLVLFLTEQGFAGPFGKWTLYDAGVRNSLIAAWPGHVPAGRTSDALLQVNDLLPTWIELAGGQPPEMDGTSMAPVLLGAEQDHRDVVYGVHTSTGLKHNREPYPIRSVRDARYKLIWNLAPGNRFTNAVTEADQPGFFESWRSRALTDASARGLVERYQRRPEYEFYDLQTDPHELNNLAGVAGHATRIAALRTQLEAWMGAQGDAGLATESRAFERQQRRHLRWERERIDLPEAGTVRVRATLSRAPNQTVGIPLIVRHLGGAEDADYDGVPEELFFEAGATSQEFEFSAVNDGDDDDGEAVIVAFGELPKRYISVGEAMLVIGDDDDDGGGGRALTAGFESPPESHAGTPFRVQVLFSEAVSLHRSAVIDPSIEVTGGEVTMSRRVDGAHNRWEVGIEPSGTQDVVVALASTARCTVGACTVDGRGLSHRLEATVPFAEAAPELPSVTLEPVEDAVVEGVAAPFRVTLSGPQPVPVAVSVSVIEDGSMLAAEAPEQVLLDADATVGALSVSTMADAVVESDSDVTVTLIAGNGYVLGELASATVTVRDDDVATFGLTTSAADLTEGAAATLTLALQGGVTYGSDQEIALTVSGASSSDYVLEPALLTLAAGESAVTATLTALDDAETEPQETVRVAALMDQVEVATASLTIAANTADTPGTMMLSTMRPTLGRRVTATLTDADGQPDAVAWQWARSADAAAAPADWSDIAGAVADSYTPTRDDEGRVLRAMASYSDGIRSGRRAWVDAEHPVADRPNVVLIMADDVGYESFGAYGSTQYSTPRIDALAAEGVRFTNAFARPKCTPGRVAMMTGRSNVRNYVDFGVLRPDESTIAHLFADAGYATAVAGKWQLQASYGASASDAGFGTYCLWGTDATGVRSREDNLYWEPYIECDGELLDTDATDYGPDAFADFLLAFMASHREQPFFAYYPMVLPHYPYVGPPGDACADESDKQCHFESMVTYLDGNVGRIRDTLSAEGLLDNTILVFTSDNGLQKLVHSELAGVRIDGEKGTTLDAGSRVPLIARVPAGAAGSVLDDLIDITDVLPTLADGTGLSIGERERLDGVSFWPRLLGQAGDPREWIYTYYFPTPYARVFADPNAHPPTAYARDARYKLYGTGELFEVPVDPHELYPLAEGAAPVARSKLQAVLDAMPARSEAVDWDLVTATASARQPRPRWRPVLSAATVQGSDLTLAYAGILDTSGSPSASSYAVEVDGSARAVSSVSMSDSEVRLQLASAVSAGEKVTVSYTPGERAIRHRNRRNGNTAAGASHYPVGNETPPPPPPAAVTLAANAGAVVEGQLARFTVTLVEAQRDPFEVGVEVTQDGAFLSGAAPESVRFAASQTRAALVVATDNDRVVEGDGSVTVVLRPGDGYTLGEGVSATVAVADDDEASFSLEASAADLAEGAAATLTLALQGGVTYGSDQEIALAVSGVSSSDYVLDPALLTLAAGESAVTATLTALDDAEAEPRETVRIAALVGQVEVATASLTIAASTADTPGTMVLSTMQPTLGRRVTATLTDADGQPDGVAWQWARSADATATLWSDIAGAVADSYTPTRDDEGWVLRAMASYSDGVRLGRRAQVDAEHPVADRPNVVLIMADDVGYESFGAYGSTQYSTPRIDALAAEGVRFTNAFARPRCTPGRVALMTGRSNVRNYVDFGVLRPDESTIAHLFADAGYATAVAGKWQLQTSVGASATDAGFGSYCLWGTDAAPWGMPRHTRYWQPTVECDGEILDTDATDYGPDLFAEYLLAFMASHREQPFFAYYPMVLPHYPYEGPPDDACADEGDEQCHFENMIAYLDGNVGRMRDKLSAEGLLENTILVFTSDNGLRRGVYSDLGGVRIGGEKGTTLDAGSRVPLIARVPAGAAGSVLDDLIDITDVLPTLADGTGLSIGERERLDGVSFWPRLLGQAGQPREWIYTYYFPRPYVTAFSTPSRHPPTAYARDARYKLYGTGELFEVSVDPQELHPLAEGAAAVARSKLQVVLDAMPARGEAVDWDSVTATALAGEPRPRWRPVLSAATVQGSDLTLAYAGILDTSGSPPASSFAVEVDGSARAVSSVSMSDSEVRLQLASAVSAGREVTVSYTPGERAIHHWHRDDGNEAAAVSHYSARNETRALPENARLSSLMLSGVDIGEFDSETTAYAGAVDHAVTATTVTVSANNGASIGIEPVDSEASAPGHQVALAVGANEIAVTVTAWDGETTRTYTVTVTRKPSTDARLSSLWLSGWSLTFDAEVTAYATWVPNEVTETTVAAEPSDPEAAVAIAPADADGEAPGHQVALSEGVNWIRATVTAEDGKATRTYTVAVTRGVPPAATFEADSVPTSHDGSAFVVRLRFSEDMAMGYAWVRDTLVQSVGGRVRRAQRVDPPLNAVWDLTVEPDAATADVTLTVSAGIDLPDGRTLAAGDAATVPVLRELSVADATSTEGGTAAFEVTLDRAAAAAVTVDYATSDGSAAAGSDYAAANGTLAFAAGEAAQTVLVSVLDDAVVEDEKTFVLTLTGASGNARLADATATGTIKDDDAATFRLAVAPAEIAEGGEARVRLTIEDGVTFAADRSVGLEVSGAVSASDYALEPGTLELAAGDGSVTAVLTALADGIAEASEAARIAALLDGAEVASAALTIRDASAEARLSALTLTDVEMDTFDAATTVYAATAAGWVTVTTVTAEPEDVSAAVEIADAAGSTLGTARTSRLARGANEIAATVTAEDGVTARTYAVTVARAGSAAWGTHRPERDIDLGGSGESTAVWSDGATLWALADWDGGAAQAYELATGARLRSRDLSLDDGFSQTALFSDGATLWAPSFYGGARAYALADGARLAERDLDAALSAAGNERPSGLWSDGSIWYVSNLDDARLYAYAADGTRLESLEFGFRTGDVQGGWPWGLWSDGETLLTSWHGRGRVLAYRLADGARLPARDIDTGAVGNDDPRDVWSDGETLWVADGADRKLYAYAAPGLVRPAASGLLPVRVASRAHAVPSADPGAPVSIPDAGLRGRIASALGKPADAVIGANELAALAALDARDAGIADLTGLGHAANLVAIDLGRNPLTDLRPLAGLANLDALNLDATGADPWAVAALGGLKRLSLRDNGIGDVSALAGLAKLRALDLAGNVIEDVTPLAGLASLQALDLGGNRVEELSPLARLGATVEVR